MIRNFLEYGISIFKININWKKKSQNGLSKSSLNPLCKKVQKTPSDLYLSRQKPTRRHATPSLMDRRAAFWCMKSQQSTIFVQAHSSPTHLSRKLYPRIVITISGIYTIRRPPTYPTMDTWRKARVCSLFNATKRRITAQFFNQHHQCVVQDKGFWTVL